MSTSCKECTIAINKKSPGLQCRGFCGEFFHANGKCADVNKDQLSLMLSLPGSLWHCQACRLRTRSRSTDVDNDDNAIKSGYADKVDSSMRAVYSELKLLRESVTFCSDKISDFEAALSRINEYAKITDRLQVENDKLKNDIAKLTTRVNDLEQYSRSNNVEIVGVPEKKNENLLDILSNIGAFIGYPIDESKVDVVHRVPTRVTTGKPKNIILRCISRKMRDDILAAARVKRLAIGASNPGLAIDGVSAALFLNEHLTVENKSFYREVRALAREKNYKFCWIRNGNIYVRKEERAKALCIAGRDGLRQM